METPEGEQCGAACGDLRVIGLEIVMAEPTSPDSAAVALANLGKLLPDLKALYIDIHAHPELSMQEARTAGLAAEGLEKAGYDVRSEEHTSELQSLMRNSYDVFCLKKQKIENCEQAVKTRQDYNILTIRIIIMSTKLLESQI